MIIKDATWYSELLHILLELWGCALEEFTIPASLEPNCEMINLLLSFLLFQSFFVSSFTFLKTEGFRFLYPQFNQG